jgi:CBS domain-containing protein
MGLRQDVLNEPVSSLPLRESIAVEPETVVRDAVRMMNDKRLGCVVVVDREQRPIGTFTELALIEALLDDPDAMNQRVGEHLTAQWDSVKQSMPIASVIESMQTQNLRFVVVKDDDGRAVGLTGQRGVCEYIAEHFPDTAMRTRVSKRPYVDQREGA